MKKKKYKLTQKDLEKTFQQAMNLWVNPEIEKRKQKGWLKKDFVFNKALIIFNPNNPNKNVEIRLNEKTYLNAKIKVNRAINAEEIVYDKDVEKVEKIIPTRLPSNCGWFAIVLLNNRLIIAFDFRYNLDKIKGYIEGAKEFYESAKKNLKKNKLRPFYEECWAVVELLSICNFLLIGQKYDKHYKNIENMKGWAKLGNVKVEFSEILEKLHKLRGSARYMKSKAFEKEDTKKIMVTIKKMFKFTEKLINK